MKPPEMVKKGKTKSGKGDGFGFARTVRYYLPLFDEDEMENDPQALRRMKKRTRIANWMKFYNKSMTHRIFMFYIMAIYKSGQVDSFATHDDLFDQWHKNYYDPWTVTDDELKAKAPSTLKNNPDKLR
jgi:hypothetical protein